MAFEIVYIQCVQQLGAWIVVRIPVLVILGDVRNHLRVFLAILSGEQHHSQPLRPKHLRRQRRARPTSSGYWTLLLYRAVHAENSAGFRSPKFKGAEYLKGGKGCAAYG